MTEDAAIPRRVMAIALAVALLAALATGGLAGARLGERVSRADARELTIVEPDSLAERVAVESTSVAGFSGFGGPPALQGEVLRHGAASGITSRGFELIDGAATTAVDYSAPTRLYRIVTTSDQLALGDSVLVRIDGTRAIAILRSRLGAEGAGR